MRRHATRSLVLATAVLACLQCACRGYALRGPVSWALTSNHADLSEEAVAPPGLWKRDYPGDGEAGGKPGGAEEGVEEEEEEQVVVGGQMSSRLFSYRLEKKTSTSSGGAAPPPPPPHQETARTARYMAHFSDWAHLATISTQEQIKGIPFGNIFSISDGPLDNSTGVIYFYVTPMDYSVSDLRSNPYASLTFSEAEGDFCRQMVYDPEDPRCARLTLTGKMVEVAPEEQAFAKEALFSRHPAMAKWPVGHKWFFMKLVLVQVWLQDWVGGVSLVPLEDYFTATPY
ncbi:unnamed protein product [Ophioblennius macclurei]